MLTATASILEELVRIGHVEQSLVLSKDQPRKRELQTCVESLQKCRAFMASINIMQARCDKVTELVGCQRHREVEFDES